MKRNKIIPDKTGMLTFVDFGVALDSCLQRLRSNEEMPSDIISKLQTLDIVLNTVQKKTPKTFVSTKKNSKTHNVPLPEPSVCPICGVNQGEYDTLKSHLSNCGDGDLFKQWPRTSLCILWDCLECKYCKSKFREYAEFETHVADLHPTIKTLYCVMCSIMVINSEVNYKEHVKSKLHIHLAGRLFCKVLKNFDAVLTGSYYRCNTCRRSDPANKFCSHMKGSKKDNFIIYCKICDTALSKRTAENHIRSDQHLSWPWFPGICPLCGLCVLGKRNLLNHIKKLCPSRGLVSKIPTPKLRDENLGTHYSCSDNKPTVPNSVHKEGHIPGKAIPLIPERKKSGHSLGPLIPSQGFGRGQRSSNNSTIVSLPDKNNVATSNNNKVFGAQFPRPQPSSILHSSASTTHVSSSSIRASSKSGQSLGPLIPSQVIGRGQQSSKNSTIVSLPDKNNVATSNNNKVFDAQFPRPQSISILQSSASTTHVSSSSIRASSKAPANVSTADGSMSQNCEKSYEEGSNYSVDSDATLLQTHPKRKLKCCCIM